MTVLLIGDGFEICYIYISNNLQVIIIIMSNAINGQLVTHDSEGDIKRDYLYRVSIKALIYNDAGQILVVKEDGRPLWDLPGGGMDLNHR